MHFETLYFVCLGEYFISLFYLSYQRCNNQHQLIAGVFGP